MRRVLLALAATAIGLVLLLSYKAHSPNPQSSALSGPEPGETVAPATGALTEPSTAAAGAGASTAAGASSGAAASSKKAKSGVYSGDPETSQFSTIQVKITVSGGRISDITLIQDLDDDEHSAEVDAYATPILRSEALSAQSANVDVVSGATFTSESYTQSLQSAIDRAGL
jgi:uncharacterized protein with FMN-binding domain